MSEVLVSREVAECWLALARAVNDSTALEALKFLPKGSARTVAWAGRLEGAHHVRS
jgi:hypothetical protein